MIGTSTTEIQPFPATPAERLPRRVATALWSVAVILAIVSFVIVIATLSTPAPEAGYLRGSVALFALAWATIGARIAARHPANAVGWLMLAAGVGFGFIAVTQELVIAAPGGPGPWPGVEATVRLVRVSAFFTSIAAGLTILLFPDGHLPSRPWLLVAVAVVVTNALGMAIAVFAPLPPLDGVADPFAVAEGAYLDIPVYALARYGGPLALALCFGALLARFPRAASVERRQLTWVAAAGGLAVITNVIANALPLAEVLQLVQLLSLLAVPVAVGIAMARYRLYDIDVILNRTLVYVIVSGFLAGLTAALVGLSQSAFLTVTGQRSDAAIVITTLILVGTISPLREVAQRFVDRHLKAADVDLTGLPAFTTEVHRFATISAPERVVMRLLSECVAAFEALGGAAELRGAAGADFARSVGDWRDEVRVTTTISGRSGEVARIRLGPRLNGEPYSEHQVAELRSAAEAVADLLAQGGPGTPGDGVANPEAAAPAVGIDADLAEVVAGAMRRYVVPGLALGLRADGRQSAWGFGHTSVEDPLPVQTDTVFVAGSITKMVVATTVMILVDRGTLDLDAPVRSYLPSLHLADEDVAAAVTLRHLMTHTEGWVGDADDADFGEGDDALARAIGTFSERPQLLPLGSLWSYNNSGFWLAGRVIEVVTGTSLEEAIEQLVFGPLGMAHTTFDDRAVITRRVAVGHLVSEGGALKIAHPWSPPRAQHAAGGMLTTITDLMTFARFHLGDGHTDDGTSLMSAEALRSMQEPEVAAEGSAYAGIGWQVREVAGTRVLSHAGDWQGQQSLLTLVPDEGLAVASLANSDRARSANDAIAAWCLRRYLGSADAQPVPVEREDDRLDAMVGHYSLPSRTIRITRRGNRMGIAYLVGRDIDDAAVPEQPAALTTDGRIVVLDGPFKGITGDFLMGSDAHMAWVRLGGRVYPHSV